MRRAALAALAALLLAAAPVLAGSGPWGRAPVSIKVTAFVSAWWQPYITQSVADWSASPVVDLTLTFSSQPCKATNGITVCAGTYGSNIPWGQTLITAGGRGVRRTWTSLNDYYLLPASDVEKLHVVCAELGNALAVTPEPCRTPFGGWLASPTSDDLARLAGQY